MASLTEVYEGHVRTVTTSRRLYFGASLFAVGAAMLVGGIAVATTDVGEQFGLTLYESRRAAGVLAGLGLPAALLGVFAVLPAGAATRAASVIGASVSVFGVVLFGVAYPEQWFAAGHPLAPVTVVVYFFGALTALSCLFVGLATFKTRNDPGGTARMEITEEGNVRLVEESGPMPGFGSVGMFGSDPEGDVQTQTNRETPPRSDRAVAEADSAEVLTDDSPTQGAAATADGGSAAVGGAPDDAEFLDAAAERGRPDAYCGNCDHFEYVKVDGTITPYCGLADDLMDDMDACDEWTGTN